MSCVHKNNLIYAVLSSNSTDFYNFLHQTYFHPFFFNNYAAARSVLAKKWQFLDFLVQENRVDPSERGNWIVCYLSRNVLTEQFIKFLGNSRVEAKGYNDSCRFNAAHRRFQTLCVDFFFQEKRVDLSSLDNYFSPQNSIFDCNINIMRMHLRDERVLHYLPGVNKSPYYMPKPAKYYIFGLKVSLYGVFKKRTYRRLIHSFLEKKCIEIQLSFAPLRLPTLLLYFITYALLEPISNCTKLHEILQIFDAASTKFFSL